MISMWLALAAVAQAPSEDEASEEVVVWGQPFLRWDRRWYVESEVFFPFPLRIEGYYNSEIWINAMQVRAVMSCRNDGGNKRRIEAMCTIDDLSLVGLMPRRKRTDARKAVLAEIDSTLTGSEVQLQAKARGTVPNVGLEGLSSRNDRTRRRSESLRQVMMRAIVPFHLKLPRTVRNGAEWYDHESRMMSIPTLNQASGGGVQVAHTMNLYKGNFLVQSIGKAMVSVPGQTLERPGDLGTTDFIEAGRMVFDLSLDSVALFEPATGIMTERVWAVRGESTASSASTQPVPYHHVGMLRMLGDDERPAVGETKLVDNNGWVAWEPPK